jgi:hypothetical protein
MGIIPRRSFVSQGVAGGVAWCGGVARARVASGEKKRRWQGASATRGGSGSSWGWETGGGGENHGGRRRPCFGSEGRKEMNRRGGFEILQKLRGLTVNIKFSAVLGLK